MNTVKCPFKTDHEHQDAPIPVKSIILNRSDLSGTIKGSLHNWDSDKLPVCVFMCPDCRIYKSEPDDVITFGYSYKYETYVIIKENKKWQPLNAVYRDANRPSYDGIPHIHQHKLSTIKIDF